MDFDPIVQFLAGSAVNNANPPTSPPDIFGKDTISQSVGSISNAGAISANTPILDPHLYFKIGESEIKSNLLDNWSKSLAEEAKRIEEELRSPMNRWREEQIRQAYGVQSATINVTAPGSNPQAGIDSLAPIDFKDSSKIQEMRSRIADGLEGYRSDVATKTTDPYDVAFVVASVTVASTFLNVFSNVNNQSLAQSQAIQELFAHQVNVVPVAFQAQAAVLASMFGVALINFAALPALKAALSKGKGTNNRELAQNLVKETLRFVNSKVLDAFVSKLAGMNAKEEDIRNLTSILKIFFTSVALAAFYSAMVDWKITKEEFALILDHPEKGTKEEQELVKFIQAEMQKLPPELAARTRQNLLNFMEERPELSKLFEVNKSINRVAVASS